MRWLDGITDSMDMGLGRLGASRVHSPRGGRRLVSGDLERAAGAGGAGRGGRLRTRRLQARGGGAPSACRAQTFRGSEQPRNWGRGRPRR